MSDWQLLTKDQEDGNAMWLGTSRRMRIGFWAKGKSFEHHGSKDGGWRDFERGRDLNFAPTHFLELPKLLREGQDK